MKRRYFFLPFFIAILLVGLVTSIVFADTWERRTTISVEEDSGSARTGITVLVDDIEGDNLVDAGWANSYATDTRLTELSTEREFLVCDDKILFFVPSLSAAQSRSYYFHTGYSPVVSDFPVIVGDGGYVTTSDAAALEPGNDFKIEFEGWLDPDVTHGPIVVASSSSVEDTEVTSHDVDLPSGIESGDLLLMFFSTFDTEAGEPTITDWGDFTELDSDYEGGGAWRTFVGFAYKIATGEEGSTETLTTSDAGFSAHQVFRITNYVGTPAYDTITHGVDEDTSVSPNSGSLASMFSLSPDQNVLWITCFGGGSADSGVNSYPTNYDDEQTFIETSNGKACVGSAQRTTETTTENPGAFTLSDALEWVACTIAVEGELPAYIYKEDAMQVYFDEDDDFHATLIAPGYYYYRESEYESDWVVGYTLNSFSQSQEADHLLLEADYSGGNSECTYVTDSLIDLTSIDTIWIDWEQETDGEMYFIADADKTNAHTDSDAVLSHTIGGAVARVTESLDVSGLSGNHYLRVHSFADFSNADSGVKVYNVYAEYDDLDLEYSEVTAALAKVEFYVDSGTLKLDIDDSTEDSASFTRYGIPDNSNDWIISMPYFDYYEHTVSSTLIVDYDPTEMISGTTLDDEEGAAQDGTITWGTSSDDITITIGATTLSEDLVSQASGAETTGTGMLPSPSTPDEWYPSATDIADMPFYTIFSQASTDSGIPVHALYLMALLFLAVAVGLGVALFTGSAMISAIAAGVFMAVFVGSTVIGWWMVLVFAILATGTLYLARTA